MTEHRVQNVNSRVGQWHGFITSQLWWSMGRLHRFQSFFLTVTQGYRLIAQVELLRQLPHHTWRRSCGPGNPP